MINDITKGFLEALTDSFYAILPIIIILLIMQVTFLKIPKDKFIKIIQNFIIVFVGLLLFLHGVNISFIPSGEEIGKQIAESSFSWIMIIIGFILGFIVTFAEPAVKILNKEIENITTGYINQKLLLYFLSVGVGISVSISVIRIIFEIPLLYILLPIYIITLILTLYSDSLFTGIAFDSGGAVTGVMISTFLLSLTINYTKFLNTTSPLVDSLGTIALVSITPVTSILILGLIYKKKGGR